jgi:DNA-binding IclR family transcriptional regulator
MASDIPVEVRQFVANYIKSLDQLEILLLVSALPDHEWSVDDVYRVVLSNPAIVAERLENFVQVGLLKCSGSPPMYSYGPRTPELGNQIAALSAVYKMSRHKMVELIYRQESDSLKAFSDAFKLKRDK